MTCNRDCEHCVFPDCVVDELFFSDYHIEKPAIYQDEKHATERERSKCYYQKNREKVIARTSAYTAVHKDYLSQKRKERYIRNRDMELARERERYARKKAGSNAATSETGARVNNP